MEDTDFFDDIPTTQMVSDTGATKCVAGLEPVLALIRALLATIQERVKKVKSQVTFRFGNMLTLTAQFAVMTPIDQDGTYYLRIEVLEGKTQLLFK